MGDPKLIASAIKRLEAISRNKCIDPEYLDSRPSEKQMEIIQDINRIDCRYVIAGNQTGKSSLGAREVAWLFNEDHPYFDRKKQWGNRPLTLIVLGRSTKQIDNELWGRRIKPLLTVPFKEVRNGNVIQSIEGENGNKILFVSHNVPSEARQNIQGYVAQYVWLDEMPDNLSLFGEIVMRIISTNGKFLATFTPLVRNLEVRRMIDGAEEPEGKKYKIGIEDNPANKDKMGKLLRLYSKYSEEEKNARLYGEWMIGDTAVYRLDLEKNVISNLEDYHPGWRHIESVDPAGSGKSGYILITENPKTGVWTVIKAIYVPGAAATDLYREYSKLSAGLNMFKRKYDPHETWFAKEAYKLGGKYSPVFNKSGRKLELINHVQELLNVEKVNILSSCVDLITELSTCHRHETIEGKIIGASRFHLLDALQYALDDLPERVPEEPILNRRAEMKMMQKEAEKRRMAGLKLPRIWKGRRLF